MFAMFLARSVTGPEPLLAQSPRAASAVLVHQVNAGDDAPLDDTAPPATDREGADRRQQHGGPRTENRAGQFPSRWPDAPADVAGVARTLSRGL